jgi:hypothetical protein
MLSKKQWATVIAVGVAEGKKNACTWEIGPPP